MCTGRMGSVIMDLEISEESSAEGSGSASQVGRGKWCRRDRWGIRGVVSYFWSCFDIFYETVLETPVDFPPSPNKFFLFPTLLRPVSNRLCPILLCRTFNYTNMRRTTKNQLGNPLFEHYHKLVASLELERIIRPCYTGWARPLSE